MSWISAPICRAALLLITTPTHPHRCRFTTTLFWQPRTVGFGFTYGILGFRDCRVLASAAPARLMELQSSLASILMIFTFLNESTT